jgi:hypothetical protein
MTATPEAAPASVGDGLARFFEAHGFDDRSYTESWARIPLGPVLVRFPNSPSRQRALPLHDLHHVAAGYGADLEGESEVAAWEIGSGVGPEAVAWALDLVAMTPGLLAAPQRVFAAFKRGRRSRNLYRSEADHRELLGRDLAALRRDLGIPAAAPPTRPADAATFALAAAGSLLASLVGLVVFPVTTAVGLLAEA